MKVLYYSKNPQENMEYCSKNLKWTIMLSLLAAVVVYIAYGNILVSAAVLLIIDGITYLDYSGAKQMLEVTNEEELEKAFNKGQKIKKYLVYIVFLLLIIAFVYSAFFKNS